MIQESSSVTPPNPARVYEDHMVPYLFAPWSTDLLKQVEPRPGERVLDVACGTGAVLRQVIPLVGENGSVAGTDLSPAMLEICRGLVEDSRGENVELVAASAESLPFPDNSFDLVLCQQGLQFFPDRPGALVEMKRVLREGGRVGIAVWQGLEHQPVFDAFDLAFEEYFGARQLGVAYSLGNAEELEGLLSDAGFSEITVAGVARLVRFPDVENFVRLTALATAAVIPEYANLDDAIADELVASVTASLEPTLNQYRSGDGIEFPMKANIAAASC